MARVLARDGHRVLPIDADSNPNLAPTLGVPAERMDDMPTLPRDLLRRTEDGTELSRTLEAVCQSHSLTGDDGVRARRRGRLLNTVGRR